MDGLSGVASGMAVISLAIQLIQTVDKIRTLARHVAGASQELERLLSLLDRLRALLDDVRQITESQSSRSRFLVPPPTSTIFHSLKACETCLQPLREIVEKHEQQNGRSKRAKLYGDIKFALKAKDIAGYENRIQHEVVSLIAALAINSTNIQLHSIPLLVSDQQATTITASQPSCGSALEYGMYDPKLKSDMVLHTKASRPTIVLRTTLSQSSLEWLGIRYKKIVSRLPSAERGQVKEDRFGDIVSEEDMYTWTIRLLGYEICWARRRPYGSVLPSLSVYPVVDWFDLSMMALFGCGSISDLQQAFHTGALHPFMRSRDGETLLHIAARYHRVDFCRLLTGMGVKTELDRWGGSPLRRALEGPCSEGVNATVATMDTVRFLSGDAMRFDNLLCGSGTWKYWLLHVDENPCLIRWLWTQSRELFCGLDERIVKATCIYRVLCNLITRPRDDFDTDWALDFLKISMTLETLRGPEVGAQLVLTSAVYADPLDSARSYDAGSALLDLLRRLDIDIETFFDLALGASSSYPRPRHFSERKLVFEYREQGGWILGWEWDFDQEASGFLVASEFLALGAESFWASEWPFKWDDYWEERQRLSEEDKKRIRPNREARFKRRLDAKARKELKRQRKHQQRTIPGSWID